MLPLVAGYSRDGDEAEIGIYVLLLTQSILLIIFADMLLTVTDEPLLSAIFLPIIILLLFSIYRVSQRQSDLNNEPRSRRSDPCIKSLNLLNTTTLFCVALIVMALVYMYTNPSLIEIMPQLIFLLLLVITVIYLTIDALRIIQLRSVTTVTTDYEIRVLTNNQWFFVPAHILLFFQALLAFLKFSFPLLPINISGWIFFIPLFLAWLLSLFFTITGRRISTRIKRVNLDISYVTSLAILVMLVFFYDRQDPLGLSLVGAALTLFFAQQTVVSIISIWIFFLKGDDVVSYDKQPYLLSKKQLVQSGGDPVISLNRQYDTDAVINRTFFIQESKRKLTPPDSFQKSEFEI